MNKLNFLYLEIYWNWICTCSCLRGLTLCIADRVGRPDCPAAMDDTIRMGIVILSIHPLGRTHFWFLSVAHTVCSSIRRHRVITKASPGSSARALSISNKNKNLKVLKICQPLTDYFHTPPMNSSCSILHWWEGYQASASATRLWIPYRIKTSSLSKSLRKYQP